MIYLSVQVARLLVVEVVAEVVANEADVAHEANDAVADPNEQVAKEQVSLVLLGIAGSPQHGQRARVQEKACAEAAGKGREIKIEHHESAQVLIPIGVVVGLVCAANLELSIGEGNDSHVYNVDHQENDEYDAKRANLHKDRQVLETRNED